MNESESERRRRWITLGEVIALAALIVSATGVWIAWKSSNRSEPTKVVEQRQSVPLALRARPEGDGQKLEISPVEPSHALESLRMILPGGSAVDVGSDGELDANDVASALKTRDKEPKDRILAVGVQIDAHYVEAGKDRRGGGAYTLRYKWEGGGLFGGRSLRLVGLSKR